MKTKTKSKPKLQRLTLNQIQEEIQAFAELCCLCLTERGDADNLEINDLDALGRAAGLRLDLTATSAQLVAV